MRPSLLLSSIVLAALMMSPADARRRTAEPARMRLQVDANFGTVAAIPTDWKELPASADWAGRRFMSPDGTAWIAIYGAPQDKAGTDEHMKTVIEAEGEDITFVRNGARWLVVSGVKADRIFYRKAVLTCGDTMWHHIAFEYPAAKKRAYDRVVTLAAQSLGMEPGRCDQPRRRDTDPLVGQAH